MSERELSLLNAAVARVLSKALPTSGVSNLGWSRTGSEPDRIKRTLRFFPENLKERTTDFLETLSPGLRSNDRPEEKSQAEQIRALALPAWRPG